MIQYIHLCQLSTSHKSELPMVNNYHWLNILSSGWERFRPWCWTAEWLLSPTTSNFEQVLTMFTSRPKNILFSQKYSILSKTFYSLSNILFSKKTLSSLTKTFYSLTKMFSSLAITFYSLKNILFSTKNVVISRKITLQFSRTKNEKNAFSTRNNHCHRQWLTRPPVQWSSAIPTSGGSGARDQHD